VITDQFSIILDNIQCYMYNINYKEKKHILRREVIKVRLVVNTTQDEVLVDELRKLIETEGIQIESFDDVFELSYCAFCCWLAAGT